MLDVREDSSTQSAAETVSAFDEETKWESLRDAIDRGGWFEVVLAVEIAVALADYLEERPPASDLRPETILIGRRREAQPAAEKIAVRLCPGGQPDVRYLSPEAVTGSPPDGASEVYALGATLYEMLTDRPPFDAETPEEVCRKRMFHAPIPPALLRPEIPDGVSRVVGRMLAGKPEQRYATPTEARCDLAAWLVESKGRGVESPPVMPPAPAPNGGPVGHAAPVPTFRTLRELTVTPPDRNIWGTQAASVILLVDLLAVAAGGLAWELGAVAALPAALAVILGLRRTHSTQPAASPTEAAPPPVAPSVLFKSESDVLAAAIHRVMPTYQPPGPARSVSGSVSVRVTVNDRGLVTGVAALSGPTELIPPSVAAAREWRFRPDVIGDQTAGFVGKVTFHFGKSG